MKAILINSDEQTVTEVEVENDIHAVQKLINCDCFERVRLQDHKQHDVWIDESGILPHRYRGVRFMINSYPEPLSGNGLILGSSMGPDGEDWDSCTLTLKEAASEIAFFIKDVNPNAY